MKHITTEIEINASAERVWRILTDLESYPSWNPLIRKASGNVELGGQLSLLIQPPGLMSRNVKVKVLGIEPNREFRWLGRMWLPRLLDGDHSFVIEPIDDNHVRVIQRETFSGILAPILGPWVVPNMQKAFEDMNKALKVRAEQTNSA